MFTLGGSSEMKLAGVVPAMQRLVRRAAQLSEVPFQIVQGNRSQREQDALFEQGRSTPGPIVTWTRNSNHIGGRAVDFAVLRGTTIDWDTTALYAQVAGAFKRAASELGIAINWGGDWRSKDWGHIELQKGTPSEQAVAPQPAGPAGVISIPLEDVIRRGDHGEAVKRAQRLLAALGFAVAEDGDFGPVTDLAVRTFQKAHGLAADGILGPKTWPVLATASPPPTPLSVAPIDPTLDRPHSVMAILVACGWYDYQAAALVGQAMRESYPDLRPDVWGDQHSAYGIWQLRGSRLESLKAYAASKQKPISDLETQAKFADWELRGPEKAVGDALAKTANIDEALRVAIGYERPYGYRKDHPENGNGWSARERYAKSLLSIDT